MFLLRSPCGSCVRPEWDRVRQDREGGAQGSLRLQGKWGQRCGAGCPGHRAFLKDHDTPARHSPTPAAPTLGLQDGRLSPTGARALVFVLHALQHGRVFQHVGQNQEADLAAPDVHLLQLSHAAVSVCDRDVGHLQENRPLQ